MNSSIFLRFTHEALHSYPQASGPTEYLKYPHRHLFHFEIQMEVFHDNREVEFLQLRNQVKDFIKDTYGYNFYSNSCEMVARNVLNFLISNYGDDRNYRIIVSEDNENGAILEKHRTT